QNPPRPTHTRRNQPTTHPPPPRTRPPRPTLHQRTPTHQRPRGRCGPDGPLGGHRAGHRAGQPLSSSGPPDRRTAAPPDRAARPVGPYRCGAPPGGTHRPPGGGVTLGRLTPRQEILPAPRPPTGSVTTVHGPYA